MKNKKFIKYILNIIYIFLLSVCMCIEMKGIVNASSINVNGVNADNATITNSKGEIISPNTKLGYFDPYTVTYHWSIPNGVIINNGDSASITLPNNVRVAQNTSFDIYNNQGQVIGVANFPANSSKGTITFNNALHNSIYDRSGIIHVDVYGTNKDITNNGNKYNKTLVKGGVISKTNNGKPSQITWEIILNAGNKDLGNVTIQDKINNGQTLVPSSVTVKYGYSINGNATIEGNVKNAIINAHNNNLTISIPNVTKNIIITYNTTIDNVQNNNTWENTVNLTGNNINQHATAIVNYGGSGEGNGYNDTVILTKLTPNKVPLSNAHFKLINISTNTIVNNNLITNNEGKIEISNLIPDNYEFIETKAPMGYKLNSLPLKFTIKNENTEEEQKLQLSMIDELNTNSSSSKKEASTPVVVPSSSSKKEASPSVVVPSSSSKKEASPSIVVPSSSSKKEASPSIVVPSSSSKKEASPSIVVPSSSSKKEASPSIVVPSSSSKKEASPSVVVPSSSNKQSRFNRNKKINSKLPQTDNNDNKTIVIIGIIVILLGISIISQRNKTK